MNRLIDIWERTTAKLIKINMICMFKVVSKYFKCNGPIRKIETDGKDVYIWIKQKRHKINI